MHGYLYIRMFYHVPGTYIHIIYIHPITSILCTHSSYELYKWVHRLYSLHMPKSIAHTLAYMSVVIGQFLSYLQMHVRPQWQWLSCQSSCHLCWHFHCPPVQSVQWCMQWCTRDCRGAELSWEVVSCAAPLSCPSPSCAGLLPPSMQGEGTMSKEVQKDH